jgi:probable addiction module antidote protein
MKNATSFDQHLINQLRKNESFREAYLNEALNEKDFGTTLLMFKNVADALGGVAKLSKVSGLNRQNLYRAFSGKRDPAYSTVEGIVHGLGFKIRVEPIKKRVVNVKKKKDSKLVSLAKEKVVLGFDETTISVRSAKNGEEELLSRGQAKSLMLRVENFKTVMLDFEGVKSVGPAFADEIFRVYKNQHPQVALIPIHAAAEVHKMINRAKATDIQ